MITPPIDGWRGVKVSSVNNYQYLWCRPLLISTVGEDRGETLRWAEEQTRSSVREMKFDRRDLSWTQCCSEDKRAVSQFGVHQEVHSLVSQWSTVSDFSSQTISSSLALVFLLSSKSLVLFFSLSRSLWLTVNVDFKTLCVAKRDRSLLPVACVPVVFILFFFFSRKSEYPTRVIYARVKCNAHSTAWRQEATS